MLSHPLLHLASSPCLLNGGVHPSIHHHLISYICSKKKRGIISFTKRFASSLLLKHDLPQEPKHDGQNREGFYNVHLSGSWCLFICLPLLINLTTIYTFSSLTAWSDPLAPDRPHPSPESDASARPSLSPPIFPNSMSTGQQVIITISSSSSQVPAADTCTRNTHRVDFSSPFIFAHLDIKV